jgi:hypothetical protein
VCIYIYIYIYICLYIYIYDLYIYTHTYIYRSRELGETRDTRLEVEALPGKAEGMAFEFDRVFGPLSSQAFLFCKKQNRYCNVDFHWNVYVCNVYMYGCMDMFMKVYDGNDV